MGLTVGSLASLARLAHMTTYANVRFQLGVNWYRKANGPLSTSDPSGVLYRIELPAPWEPEPGGYPTVLQILGLYLAELRSESWRVRRKAAHGLATLGTVGARAIPALKRVAERDLDRRVGEAAAEALRRLGNEGE